MRNNYFPYKIWVNVNGSMMTIRKYQVYTVSEQTCVSKTDVFSVDGHFTSTKQESSTKTQSSSSTFQEHKLKKLYKNKCRKYFKINVPMVPLKASLFLWWSCGGLVQTYFNLYLLQLGITVPQLSPMNASANFIQFISSTIAGIISDKIGRCKPVLFANLVLIFVAVNSVLFVPPMEVRKCFLDGLEIQCNPEFKVKDPKSSFRNDAYACYVECASNVTFYHVFSPLETVDGPNPSITETLRDGFNRTEAIYGSNLARENSTRFCQSILKENCTSFCDGGDDRILKEIQCPKVEDNSILVFTVCFIIICFTNVLNTNAYIIMDLTTTFMANTYGSNFGHEKFWAMLSMVLMLPLAGYLIDLTTPEGGSKNYVLPLYLFDGMLAILMVFVYKLDVKIYPPSHNMVKNIILLMKDLDVVAFALAVLVLGTSSAFAKIYSFIYLDQLGSPGVLLGLMVSINSICGLPFLLTSDWWIRTLGCSNLVLCGFLGNIFFCLGYSFLVDVWYALIFETSAIFTYHLLWVAVVRQCHQIAPEGLAATVITSAGAVHYGLGRAIGDLIGGQMMSRYGGKWAFMSVAILCSVFFIFYAIFLYYRKRRVNPDTEGD